MYYTNAVTMTTKLLRVSICLRLPFYFPILFFNKTHLSTTHFSHHAIPPGVLPTPTQRYSRLSQQSGPSSEGACPLLRGSRVVNYLIDQAHPLSGNRYCWMPISDPLDSWPLATLTISISHTCCLHPWVSDILGSSTPLGLQCSVLSFPSLPVPVYAQGSHLLLPEGGQVTRWDSGLPIHGSVSRM